MIDLHLHTLFSDGVLIPAELVRRLEFIGYEAAALTDHADSSNLDFIVPRIVKAAEELNKAQSVRIIPGIELTHTPVSLIASLVEKARALGARLVVMHGETIVEPVAAGTNRAALEAGVDILAHPGLIKPEDAELAATKEIFLEISARKGHCLTNGHVFQCARQSGAGLVLNSDGHGPQDLLTRKFGEKVVQGAGMPGDALGTVLDNSRKLIKRIDKRAS
jgi:histidinol phosphatase-like PHP family hydrolase